MGTEPADMWARQEKRSSLAEPYWKLAGGRPGVRIADVGCGPGYFARWYASATGPTGHVHAVDVDADALAYLRAQLDPVHHAHVTTERLDLAQAPLPDLRFDAILCTDVLHHVAPLGPFLRNLRAAAAPLVVGEFDPRGPGDLGPPLDERLDPDALTTALRAAGFAPRPWLALPHEHFAMVAAPG